ncbi:glycosyltransferase family 2 protein [Plebeiibacterium sediminum]|uniref:Glycosyltransferase family 2 protein n=1 Tax=Plebeiibacterium sediminum TaxID=2992112 RepID=A0AAE3M362_9BACT|nr:glycosyltransferase family 2 protein [Plebeiobacterium sediminum]MCW3786244.1 glycosyltransferase family 2 protein [Plebeiobacterium sediminum]
MDNDNYTFTVFTPAYKCEKTIHRVFESLENQTFKDFEWIIVDDASPDNFQSVLKNLLASSNINFKILVHDENKGKHFAWNLALKYAKGKFFVPADADDSFIPETLEIFLSFWNQIPKNQQNEFSGVNVLCKDPYTNKIIGNKYPNAPLVSNNLELGYRYKINGEKWGMIRTDILRKYPFPEFKSNRGAYVESYIWFSIANAGYKVICHNIALRNYYMDDSNSIIQKAIVNPKKSSKTMFHYLSWHINNNFIYMIRTGNYKLILKNLLNLFRNGWLENNSSISIIKILKDNRLRLILIPFVPFFYIVYLITYSKFK